MNITFFGGAGEVGRSCIFLQEEKQHLLLDAGAKLGEKDEYPLISEEELGGIHNIVASHAHLDHIGYLPHAFAKGCTAAIHTTKPTRELASLLLEDYFRLQKIKNFALKDVKRVVEHMHGHEYGKRVHPSGGLPFSLHNAGHILGSAMVQVDANEGNGPSKRVLYSGDMNMRAQKILDVCERGLRADTLIMECTYGAKDDKLPAVKDVSAHMAKVINETIKKGGVVLIPAFAVGRGQEVLMILENQMRSGLIPDVPIWVDGMVRAALKIYRNNPKYCKPEIAARIAHSKEDPFASPLFHEPRNKSEPLKKPGIIVATSGMLTGGPAIEYLSKLGPGKENALIVVGYQAAGTRGRKLLDGADELELKGKKVPMRLRVENAHLSAHADHADLVQFAKGVKGLKKIFLVHGEGKNKFADLADALGSKYEIVIPKNGETHPA